MVEITQAELEAFYEGLVEVLRANGAVCAITSGMACVRFGVAFGTKDCDVLCLPENAGIIVDRLAATNFHNAPCSYRGHLSAPLDARWLRGGWTSHFVWRTGSADASLDVFGVAPRASAPWDAEVEGLYVGLHTVAEMKRTDREKDWPFATALGAKLLRAGDPRGWLHIFDCELLLELVDKVVLPSEIVARRPALRLLRERDSRLEVALKAEIEFWRRLDKRRLHIYRNAVQPYAIAVKQDSRSDEPDVRAQHGVRVEHAQRLLPMNPLKDHGVDRLVSEAREEAARFLPAGSLEWLPDVRANFVGLQV